MKPRPPMGGGSRGGPGGRGRPGAGRPVHKERHRVPGSVLRRLQIAHEDAEVIVVDKPPGLLTASPKGEDRDNLFDLVKEHVRGKKKPTKVWIIHRLDKEASGLLVFAKSEKAYE